MFTFKCAAAIVNASVNFLVNVIFVANIRWSSCFRTWHEIFEHKESSHV